MVNKILARRVVRQRTDYLIAWEGYDEDGDTFEPKEHLPRALIVAFDRYMATLPPSFDIVLRQLRDGFARKLLESNGPMFGVEIEVEMAALPEYADALLAGAAACGVGWPTTTPSVRTRRRLDGRSSSGSLPWTSCAARSASPSGPVSSSPPPAASAYSSPVEAPVGSLPRLAIVG